MIARSALSFFLLVLCTFTPLWAKGDTVQVEIKGGARTSPIQITDPKSHEFNVWAGPGANHAPPERANGFVGNWQTSAMPPPGARLEHYQVSFYVSCLHANDQRCASDGHYLAYVVSYDFDPALKQGYVYLPGHGEPWFELNAASILRGPAAEGHWFLAADSWDAFVRPIIERALDRH